MFAAKTNTPDIQTLVRDLRDPGLGWVYTELTRAIIENRGLLAMDKHQLGEIVSYSGDVALQKAHILEQHGLITIKRSAFKKRNNRNIYQLPIKSRYSLRENHADITNNKIINYPLEGEITKQSEKPTPQTEQARLIKLAYPTFNDPAFLQKATQWTPDQVQQAIDASRDKLPSPIGYFRTTLESYPTGNQQPQPTADQPTTKPYNKYTSGPNAAWVMT